MARKGDLKPYRHLNVALDEDMFTRLLASAARNERKLTEECRFAVRLYLTQDRAPAQEVNAGV